MALAQAAGVRQGCARCGGPLYRSYHDRYCEEYGCLYCGEYVFSQAPQESLGKGKTARARLVAEWLGEVTGKTG